MIRLILPAVFCSFLIADTKAAYREAEILEERFLYDLAISKYRKILGDSDRRWKRRAAYRIARIIRDIHFQAGRSELVRSRIVSTYKTLLADFTTRTEDPELWDELKKELRWTRLGLKGPDYLF